MRRAGDTLALAREEHLSFLSRRSAERPLPHGILAVESADVRVLELGKEGVTLVRALRIYLTLFCD